MGEFDKELGVQIGPINYKGTQGEIFVKNKEVWLPSAKTIKTFLRTAIRRVVTESFAGVRVEGKELQYDNIADVASAAKVIGHNSAVQEQGEKLKEWLK